MLEMREKLQSVAGDQFQSRERRIHIVGLVRIDLSSHDYLAACTLIDIDVQVSGHDYLIEERLQGLSHTSLQRMSHNRQLHPDHAGDSSAPARGCVDDDLRVDCSTICHDTRDATVIPANAADLGVCVHL